MNVTGIQESSFAQGYLNNNLKEQQSLDTEIKTDEDKKILDHRNLTDEEAKNLYLSYQTYNLMKTKIDIYLSIEEQDLEYKDIRELKKSENRLDAITYYNKQSNTAQNDSKFEAWV